MTIAKLYPAMIIIYKTFEVLKAGYVCYQTFRNKDRTRSECVDATAQALFAVAQTGEIIPLKGLSASRRIVLSGAVSLADISRQVTHGFTKDKWTKTETLSLVQTTVFRCADFTSTAGSLKPETFGKYTEKAGTICEVSSTVWGAYQGKEDLIVLGKFLNACIRRRRNEAISSQLNPIPLESLPSPPVLTPALLEESTRQLELLQNIQNMKEIPEILFEFCKDNRMRKCSISGKYIRFIAFPNKELRDKSLQLREVFFEKSALEAWIKQRSEEMPPGLSRDALPLPLKVEYFEPFCTIEPSEKYRDKQGEIDERLEIAADQMKPYLLASQPIRRDIPDEKSNDNVRSS